MNSTILRYDARRLFPFWILSILGLGCYYLIIAAPLYSSAPFNSFPIVLGAILFGLMIGGRLIADTGATHAFVLSRGLTRRQLFLHRLVLGLLVIFATSAMLWLLLASSIRSNLHQWMQFEDAAYYPMLAQFEARAAFGFCKLAVGTLLAIVCLQTLRGVRDADQTTTATGQVKFWLAELPLMLMCTVPILARSVSHSETMPVRDVIWNWGPSTLCVVGVAVALYVSRYTEAGR